MDQRSFHACRVLKMRDRPASGLAAADATRVAEPDEVFDELRDDARLIVVRHVAGVGDALETKVRERALSTLPLVVGHRCPLADVGVVGEDPHDRRRDLLPRRNPLGALRHGRKRHLVLRVGAQMRAAVTDTDFSIIVY